MRKAVLERDGYSCQYPGCNRRHPYWQLGPHHIKFKSMGRADVLSNLVSLCYEHHTVGRDAAHQSRKWKQHWERWATERYGPDYWRKVEHKVGPNNNEEATPQ